MQGKWEEMFGEKKGEMVEEVKAKKPRKKAVAKKKVTISKIEKPIGKTSAKKTKNQLQRNQQVGRL